MKTLEEVLCMLEARIDRPTLEDYIDRQWVRPHREMRGWYFEDIDIARLELVCHLTRDMEVNEEGMDVVLLLLDQLYGLRGQMQKLASAIAQQPPKTQADIRMILQHWPERGEAYDIRRERKG